MAGCRNITQEYTIEIPEAGLEIAPYSADFRRGYKQLDYFSGRFHPNVGEHIDEHLNGGVLDDHLRANIKFEDKESHTMVWRPESASFGGGDGHNITIELFDAAEGLDRTTIYNHDKNTVRNLVDEIYESYVESHEDGTEPLLDGIRVIGDPVEERVVLGDRGYGIGFLAEASVAITPYVEPYERRREIEVEWSSTSCFDALVEVANAIEYDIYTYSALGGDFVEIVLGKREATEAGQTDMHFVSADYGMNTFERDVDILRAGDFHIRNPRNRISTVRILGDEESHEARQGVTTGDQRASLHSASKSEVGTDPGKIEQVGVAEATRDVRGGGTDITIRTDLVEPDEMKSFAVDVMTEMAQDERKGYIEIIPQLSGTEKEDYRDIDPGDVLRTVAPMGDSCRHKDFLYANDFIVTEMTNTYNDGLWTIDIDVVNRVDPENIETSYKVMDVKDLPADWT